MVTVDAPASTVRLPGDVVVVGTDTPPEAARSIHEVVLERRFRISAGSFFQSRADGADALVATVLGAIRREGCWSVRR
ncbi:MAG: hypothetical protein R2698_01425 [Microthrixaceae bacterium]